MIRRRWKPNLDTDKSEFTCGNCSKSILNHQDDREWSCCRGLEKDMVKRHGNGYVTVTSPCSGQAFTYYDPDKTLIK